MQISPNCHAIKIPFQIPVSPEVSFERFVYAYVIDADKLCLIDSGVRGAESLIFDTVRKIGRKPADIDTLLLTHSHPDHIGTAKVIKTKSNCFVYAHPAAKEWVEDVEKQYSDRPVPGFHTLVAGSVTLDRLYDDNKLIDLGGTSLQVLYTPGHSQCSVSLFCKSSGILFTGDAIPQGNDLPIYDDVAIAVESIKKMKKTKGIKYLLSSWRDPFLDENPYCTMDQGLQYFQRIHLAIRQITKKKNINDPMDLCREVVAGLGLPELAVNPLVARSLYSHMGMIDSETL